jgi:hypothetical protein
MDTDSLRKIQKTTGMVLVHIRSYNGVAELWFSRRRMTLRITDPGEKEDKSNLQLKP